MILKSIKFRNFMPFLGDESEINFSTDQSKKVTLVDGQNTNGKTSIGRAIQWCLYGNIKNKGIKISYKNILNWSAHANKDYSCCVELNFDHQGSAYRLNRDFKNKGSHEPIIDSDFEEHSTFWKDGAIQSKTQQEEVINQMLPEAIANFSLFDGELLDEYDKLLQEGDEGKKLKEDIEKVLGVPALINGFNDIALLRKEAEKEVQKDRSANNVDKQILAQIDKINTLKKESDNAINMLNEEQKETQEKIIDIEKETSSIEDQISNNVKYQADKIELKRLRSDLANIEKEEKEATKYAWKFLLKQKILKKENEVSKEDTEQNYYKKLGRLEYEQEKLNDLIQNNSCSLCSNSPLDINKFQDELKQKIQEVNDHIKSLDNSNFTKSQSLKKILDDTGNKNISEIIEERKNARVTIQEQETKLDNFMEGMLPDDVFKAMQKKLERLGRLKGHEEELRDKIRTEEAKKVEFDTQIQALTRDLSNDSVNVIAQGITAKQKFEIYEKIGNAFKESTVTLRDELKEKVEQVASENFLRMVNRKNYQSLQINDNYGLSIMSEEGVVQIRSAGASQVVALSLISALSQVGTEIRPILMDTPFGRLDKTHRKNILKTLPDLTTQLILLHHDGEIGLDDLINIKSIIGCQYEVLLTNDSKNSYIKKV
ncbi:hypothetical protein MB2181_05325 [Methylophilales bacterium HTCC2181]|uniref:Rad50/SbcC-type AAA domain-containing protein n=1 Tax=Methylophilales bacterium HTCC2181 TaxID=383631 RepID=A0P7G2_9PROT|nr:hypothetical protein MB2181_05325 [Methylophilales bacterium HTCC2181]